VIDHLGGSGDVPGHGQQPLIDRPAEMRLVANVVSLVSMLVKDWTEMIMTLDVGERLMSITDLSEMLGVPIHTLYRWRHKGEGPVGYRIGRHVKYRRATVEAWLETQADER
jgi:excisionase family DNA binding protein